MKIKISEALGYALIDNNVKVITHVPGFGVSETIQEYSVLAEKPVPLSFNEEVAYTISHGAGLVGQRSSLIIKAHGILKAANSVMDSLYTDITAGFVVIIFDDKTGKHSDNILDVVPILKGFSLPYMVAEDGDYYGSVGKAFAESEKRKLPVALIIDSAVINNSTNVERQEVVKKNYRFLRDVLSHVVHPMFAEYQFKKFTAKTLGGNPEQILRPQIPKFPDSLPDRYKATAKKYIPFFDAFKNVRGQIVTGDTSISSSFCMPPYNAIDLVTYIGGSIPLAIGAYLSGVKDVWALTGDFGFLSAGHMGLLETFNRGLPIKIVIFYNKQASATGGQSIQNKIMSKVLSGYDKFIAHITNPNDLIEITEVLKEVKKSETLRIILINY